MCNSKEWI